MGNYIVKRLIQSVPTFFGITIITFMLILSAPGDPIALITFNPVSSNNPELTEALRRRLGLDQPPLTQYLYWLIGNDWTTIDTDGDGVGDESGERQGLLRGDFGDSIKQNRPVLDLIGERIAATTLLTFSSLVLGYGAGIALGVLAAVYHKTWIDHIVRVVSVLGNSIPAFWLGLVLIIIFSVQLDWLPMGGMRDIASRDTGFNLWETLRYMILPVSVLSFSTIAYVSRFMRTELLEVLEQDYIRTAQSKGMRDRRVWWLHAIRNALIPIATFIGPALGSLLAGAVIIEQVFSWPGMGRLVVNAVFQRDYPLVMGSVVVASLLFILGVLISDVLYVLLDPRIRLR